MELSETLKQNMKLLDRAQADLNDLNSQNTDLYSPEEWAAWERAVGLNLLIYFANSAPFLHVMIDRQKRLNRNYSTNDFIWELAYLLFPFLRPATPAAAAPVASPVESDVPGGFVM